MHQVKLNERAYRELKTLRDFMSGQYRHATMSDAVSFMFSELSDAYGDIENQVG